MDKARQVDTALNIDPLSDFDEREVILDHLFGAVGHEAKVLD
jgi:hypothetical protein